MALQDAPLRDPGDVTTAEAWRSGTKAGFVIELPSGKKARVKRSMNLLTLLEKGKIPNPLAGVVREMIATRSANFNAEGKPEVIEQLLELVNRLVIRNFVEPRVEVQPEDWDEDDDGEWEPSEGAIALDDVDLQDRMFVFAFSQGMARDLESFRQGQAAAMANLQDGKGVEGQASGTPEPDGPVPGVLPGRGDLDVGESRQGDDGGSSGGAGQTSGAAGSAAAGTPAATDGPSATQVKRNKRAAARKATAKSP